METPKTLQPWGDNSCANFHMVDVAPKSATYRRAEARGTISMSPSAFALVRDRKLPKGDALALAEVAAILAAKHTPNLLPLCHPLPIEEVKVRCELDEKTSSVQVICQVSTTAKTGVEMEALMGTNGALLCLYDLIKMVDPALRIDGVRLKYKQGGKSGLWQHPEEPSTESAPKAESENTFSLLKCAVLTTSDRVAQNKADDLSGPMARNWLNDCGASSIEMRVVADEKDAIISSIRAFVQQEISLVVVSGGTGMGPRDVTIDALKQMGTKEMKGIGEELRRTGSKIKKSAVLSNSGGFILGDTLIIALPGSPKAVEQGLDTLSDILPHALHILKGGNHG